MDEKPNTETRCKNLDCQTLLYKSELGWGKCEDCLISDLKRGKKVTLRAKRVGVQAA